MRFLCCFILAVQSTGATQSAGADLDSAQIRRAVQKSIALLQKTGKEWFGHRSCTSCHHSTLPTLALVTARRHGVTIDELAARDHFRQAFAYLTDLDSFVQGIGAVGLAQGDGYALWAAQEGGMPRNTATGALAKMLASQQKADGHWRTPDVRPPQSGSLFTVTALSLRALNSYLPARLDAETRRRVARARHWLETSTPFTEEDSTFQLLGSNWAGSPAHLRNEYARKLIDRQLADGGWSQIPSRSSDAYATGQVLFALIQGSGMTTANPAVQRGLSYLLKTQLADGSWLVESRMHDQPPVSPNYFETGFPHGKNQVASCSGTSWAVMALSLALPWSEAEPLSLKEMIPAEETWTDKALFGSVADIRGLDPNMKTKLGTTALMMVAADEKKVRVLLDRGADVNLRAKSGYSALTVASSYGGSAGTLRLLMARGAHLDTPNGVKVLFDTAPLIQAVISGDLANVKALVGHNANIRQKSMVFGGYAAEPLQMAVFLDDIATVEYLVGKGAPVNEPDQDGVSLLERASLFGRAGMVQLLARLGADSNYVDKKGMTPLLWASTTEFGSAATVRELLRAGARVDLVGRGGVTAVSQATKYGSNDVRVALQQVNGR